MEVSKQKLWDAVTCTIKQPSNTLKMTWVKIKGKANAREVRAVNSLLIMWVITLKKRMGHHHHWGQQVKPPWDPQNRHKRRQPSLQEETQNIFRNLKKSICFLFKLSDSWTWHLLVCHERKWWELQCIYWVRSRCGQAGWSKAFYPSVWTIILEYEFSIFYHINVLTSGIKLFQHFLVQYFAYHDALILLHSPLFGLCVVIHDSTCNFFHSVFFCPVFLPSSPTSLGRWSPLPEPDSAPSC